MKISIVTVSKNDFPGLVETIKSVSSQTYGAIESVIVISGYDEIQVQKLREVSRLETKFLCDEDTGIYDAMNKGIMNATGDYITFLNSSDTFIDHNIIEVISKKVKHGKCFASRVLYCGAGVQLIRPGGKKMSELVSIPPHPGFFAPLAISKYSRLMYSLSIPVGADAAWIKDNINAYGICVDPMISVSFKLGGLSSKPSVKLAREKILGGEWSSFIKEILRFLFYYTSKRTYYIILGVWNGYDFKRKKLL